MAFPDYQPTRLLFYRRPHGWQDRGFVEPEYLQGGAIRRYATHAYCHTRLRIGLQNGEPFRYCPRCLIQVPLSASGRKR